MQTIFGHNTSVIWEQKYLTISRRDVAAESKQNCSFCIESIRTGKKKQAKREFIMPCPDEGCKGFLSTGYKCNICEKFSCSKCLVVMGTSKDENHVCDEDLVATVEEIKKNSKPCPKGGVSTSKIDGCSQMWCVECHATWDWRTGNLVNGVIHNPHYYEILQKTGIDVRNPGDFVCGGLIQIHHLFLLATYPCFH